MKLITPILTLCLMAILMTGCSALQAKGPMAATIDLQAAAAAELLPKAQASSISEQDARDAITLNAATFQGYADHKTTNIFAYWFGGKSIFVDAIYAELLDRTALLAEETERRSTTQSAEWLNAVLVRESEVLIKVKNAKDGKK